MRSSGILLHLTSLPDGTGIGDLGAAAYRFVDFLCEARQRLWQVLPLGPIGAGASPYASPSTFAGNPLLISLERLVEEGLLDERDLHEAGALPQGHVDYGQVIPFKENLLERAFDRFEWDAAHEDQQTFQTFRAEQADWLRDYALFMALKEAHMGATWTDWPAPQARREDDALERARQTHARAARKHAFWQYLFSRQWQALHTYGHERGLQFFGDLPIYVAHDSADVWAHQCLFQLDDAGQPTAVAGVPPDYFSKTGQRWGNPLYRWDHMSAHGFAWWTRRFEAALHRVDLVRLDHFRGFEAYWSVPSFSETAAEGTWVKGPGQALFDHVKQALGTLPIVAEDLGTITPDVRALIDTLGLPGMAVLSFGLGDGPTSTFLPHHYPRRLAAYTGTHDNAPIAGWYDATDENTRAFARTYLGLDDTSDAAFHWHAIRALMASVAERTVFPLQDVLGLGNEARMNTPGSTEGNWTWRVRPDQLTPALAERLRVLTETYDRVNET